MWNLWSRWHLSPKTALALYYKHVLLFSSYAKLIDFEHINVVLYGISRFYIHINPHWLRSISAKPHCSPRFSTVFYHLLAYTNKPNHCCTQVEQSMFLAFWCAIWHIYQLLPHVHVLTYSAWYLYLWLQQNPPRFIVVFVCPPIRR